MSIINFIYYSILNTVPKKAIFGRRQVACTLFSSFLAIFGLSIDHLTSMYFGYSESNFTIGVIIIILFGGLFILIRYIFLNPNKVRNLEHKYSKTPKIILKFVEISFLIFCFFAFVITGIIGSKAKRIKKENIKNQIELYQEPSLNIIK